MCVLSMVIDHYYDEWWRRYYPPPAMPFVWPNPPTVAPIVMPTITPQEVEEFRRLLERAKQYDRDHNQPDCELEEKRNKLKDLAEKLGVKIDFV